MDAMERAEEKIAANEVTVSAEFKKKDCDLPMKPETCNVLGSSALHVAVGSDWPERSPHLYTDILAGYSLNRCVTSSVQSDSPSTNPYSRNDAGLVVEQLTLRNYETANFASVSHSNVREGMHPVQSQWQHLYQLAGGHNRRNRYNDFGSSDKNLMLLSAKEGMQNQSKMLSTSSFSQFFVKKSLKGKGVISRRTEAPTEFGLVVMDQNKEKQVSVSRIPSDTILNSSAKDNSSQQSQHNVDRGGFESFHDGISLRDWLKLVRHDINKIERLLLFRQIVQIVDFAHAQGVVLQHLCPSYFIILPSKKVKYIGSSGLIHQREFSVTHQDISRKRPLDEELHTYSNLSLKLQKLGENTKHLGHQTQLSSKCGIIGEAMDDIDTNVSDQQNLGSVEHKAQNTSSYHGRCTPMQQLSNSTNVQLEEKWYGCPDELRERGGVLSSNIYSLGVLLFELLCCFESSEVHFAAMLDLRHRILPPHFLSENPKESGFCLWLLHPEPSSRPTTREILQSELLCGSEEFYALDDLSCFDNDDDSESELLLHFLLSLKEEKQKHASKLAQDIGCLEADINEIERRHLMSTSSYLMDKDLSDATKWGPHLEDHTNSDVLFRSFSMSNMDDTRLMRNVSQLEKAYFSVRSQTQLTETAAAGRLDTDLLRNRERWSRLQNENEDHSMEGRPVDHIESFCEGLCKFARYSKFEVRGTLRCGDLLNSANVICSLSFDRDEDYIAAAGVSKKIKIFEFGALLNDSVDIHYPAVEMMNKSKLSCVCWNNYIRNYLASSDYDGVVQMWDATTGQGFAQYTEHQKRAWSVDFSQVHPKKFASGSDDCSVKLWSINEKNSFSTISNPANVCCVQFSAYSSHLLAFGSADYKTYCYDLRHTRIPWCTLAGHEKAVSYVKFLDSETLVSASTDNTLKLWDLKKTSSEGLSAGACTLTFTGHANEKNFVGLSVFDGYISCGSETNEVYTYYRSLPMPITSHKFGSVDPISGREVGDDSGQFVSSVCWRGKSNMVVAANSSGSLKLLQMV